MIGEQFKGCCHCAASKESVPWYEPSGVLCGDDRAFLAAVVAVCDSGAKDKQVMESLKALVSDAKPGVKAQVAERGGSATRARL